MSNKQALQPEKININEFKLVKGHIESPFEFDQEKVDGHSFNVNFEMGFNLDDSLVKADFEVEVITKSEPAQAEEAKGLFYFVYIFHVENLNELAKYDERKRLVNIEAGLGNALASITYSTSRGILMTRFNGTALKDFILPVIDPNSLLEK